ncbi:MAG: sugar phosphate isomerase/epimerase [Ruminococcaceae bacterium]|nr:sugar phosphate isomerase/epimerase [Oscillospiraceae bacterium]
MYRIGRSTKTPCEATFADYRTAGIEVAEISLPGELYPTFDYRAAKNAARACGVELWSFHLPFVFELYDISKKELAASAVEQLSEMISRASDIGIERIVIHPSGEPIGDGERRDRMERSKQSLSRLAAHARRCGCVLAVEDLPRTCLGRNSEEIAELISVDDGLAVCFDTNHLLGDESATDFITRLGNRIITTHVSDYDFLNERHWLPGEGKLNWSAVLKALSEVGYNGVWMYELELEAPASIKRPRALYCEDFVKNAHALFEGRAPEVLGTPAPGLTAWNAVQ